MQSLPLLEAITVLQPGAGLSLWPEEPPFPAESDPSTTRHVLFGYTVCWSTSNTSPCPTEEEISAIITQE